MITASIWIELAEYDIAEVSRSFPKATFRLLTGVRTGETAVDLGEITAKNPRDASEAVAAHPSAAEYSRRELTGWLSIIDSEYDPPAGREPSPPVVFNGRGRPVAPSIVAPAGTGGGEALLREGTKQTGIASGQRWHS